MGPGLRRLSPRSQAVRMKSLDKAWGDGAHTGETRFHHTLGAVAQARRKSRPSGRSRVTRSQYTAPLPTGKLSGRCVANRNDPAFRQGSLQGGVAHFKTRVPAWSLRSKEKRSVGEPDGTPTGHITPVDMGSRPAILGRSGRRGGFDQPYSKGECDDSPPSF